MTLFSAIAVTVGVCLLAGGRRHDLFEPDRWFILVFASYALASYAAILEFHPEEYSSATLDVYTACVVIALIGFKLGYWLVRRSERRAQDPCAAQARTARRPESRVPATWATFAAQRLDRRTTQYLTVFFIASAVIAPAALNSTFNPLAITDYVSHATRAQELFFASKSSGVWLYLDSIAVNLIFAFLLWPIFRDRKWSWWRAGASIGLALVTVAAGSKVEALTVAVLLVMAYHYRLGHRIRGWLLVAAALALFPPFVLLNAVRFTTSPSVMISTAWNDVKADPTMLLPTRSGELVGPPTTFMDIIAAHQDGLLQFAGLTSIADELAVYIPRPLYPGNRPLPLALQYMHEFHPVAMAHGEGNGFFVLGDGYIAMGLPGCLLSMMLFGAALAAGYNLFIKHSASGLAVLIYGFAWIYGVVTVTRTGLLGSGKQVAMAVAPYVLILLLVRLETGANRRAAAIPTPGRSIASCDRI